MERNDKGQFTKGHSALSREEALKRSRSLSRSWRRRKDYIGDIVNLHPRIHTSWRAIRFTDKGKEAGCVPEWEDFRTFYNDVVKTYADGLVLRRKDTSKCWGPDNFMWLTTQEAADLQAKVYLEYNGKTLSLRQWSKELGVPFSAINLRYHRYKDTYSVKEILFGRVKKRNDKKPKGVHDSRMLIRAKASKMISAYKVKDKKMGLNVCDIDIDWIIDNILLQPCHYCGETYRIGCDRIDNSRGHSKDNVIPCCYECNVARGNNFSYEEMRRLGRTIAEIKKGWPKRESNIKKDIDEERSRDLEYRRRMSMRKTYQFSLEGELLNEYPSVADAAQAVGVRFDAISAACNGRQHGTHKCLDYLWSHNKEIKIE